MIRQEYFGQLPYPADKKKPQLIREEDQKIFIFSPEMPEESNLVTVGVSTDQLHCGMLEMGPGATWHFVDEHLGDEIYFVLSGNLPELECHTGDCVETNPGEMLYIPHGCKHKGYNFSDEGLRLFWAIAPDMWPPETDTTFQNEKIRQYKNGEDTYNLSEVDEKEAGLRKAFKLTMRDVNQMGNFPLPGPEARKQPIYYYVMSEKNCITTFHGLKHPMRLRIFISNDYMDAGEYCLPPGGVGSRVSEVNSHDGDAVFYGLKGKTTVFLPNDPGFSYIVKSGDMMYIPENTPYQFINYGTEAAVGYFVNAKPLK